MIRDNYPWQILSSQSTRMWSIHRNWGIILFWKIWCCKSILCLMIYTFWNGRKNSNWWKWEWNSLFYWGIFCQRHLCLIVYPFWYGREITTWCIQNYQFMVLMELLRNKKVSQHVQSQFNSYCCHLNKLLHILNPSLYFTLTVNFASPRHDQLVLLRFTIASNYLIIALIILSFSFSRLICYSLL